MKNNLLTRRKLLMDKVMTTFRTVSIDGLDIFYREVGSRSNPTILLLHGFPTSSHMFRNLISALSDRFHLVAPDYPGYGNSSIPDFSRIVWASGEEECGECGG
ncbi:alpha/beta fold hydrolase [Nostoc sp.]|uniref:alpha/beta fold hydrolase n=1 Tax=Nostoc sp. TaxID=1180 RepID=UPI002FFAFE10